MRVALYPEYAEVSWCGFEGKVIKQEEVGFWVRWNVPMQCKGDTYFNSNGTLGKDPNIFIKITALWA